VNAWIIFLVVVLLVVGFVVWLILDDARKRIDPGSMGLVLVRGKATDRALPPGPHFVPAFRRVMLEEYPSVELALRAGDRHAAPGPLEHALPPLRVVLGDRAAVELGYTVRFRLRQESLRSIHERFGADGIWSAVRDRSAQAVRSTCCDARFGVASVLGLGRLELEAVLGAAVRRALADDGFTTTHFSLDDLDAGQAGEIAQATARADLELAREEAEAPARLARARVDGEVAARLATEVGTALRYREVDAWREVLTAPHRLVVGPPSPAPRPLPQAEGADGWPGESEAVES
jgi:regulator of protease activity HflC (stomatin/prohibitin superfamily)